MTTVKSVRSVRKLEKPRPLKAINIQNRQTISDTTNIHIKQSAENVLQDLESIAKHISNGNYDTILSAAVYQLCTDLKLFGPQLDGKYKDQVDRHFVSLRNACRDERLDGLSRVRLLEIIEMRAMQWQTNENITNYYRDKVAAVECDILNNAPLTPTYSSLSSNSSSLILPSSFSPSNTIGSSLQSVLSPGEVLRPSGKYSQPTRVPGKNYFKDEVIIRNVDSGKVMGLKGRRVHMIEELSETIISFQRVNAGAKDRLVQITGRNDESIEKAKQLIEQTICRNTSPIRDKIECGEYGSDNSMNSLDELNQIMGIGVTRGALQHSYSMNDASSLGDYKYSVIVGDEKISITGCNLELVKAAKLVLDEYFGGNQDTYLQTGLEGPTYYYPQPHRDERERIAKWIQNAKPVGSDTDSPRSSGVASDDTFIGTDKIPAYMRTLSGDKLKMKMSLGSPTESNLNPLAPDFTIAPNNNKKVYTRDFLLKCSLFTASRNLPPDWETVCDLVSVAKMTCNKFEPVDMADFKVPISAIRQTSPRLEEDA